MKIRSAIASLIMAGVLAVLALAAPARAEGVLAQGATVERLLTIDGRKLPLPEGRWVVGADGDSGWNDPKLGAYGYLRSLVLFRVTEGKLDAVLEVHTNALAATDGWGMASSCARTDLVLAVVRYRAGWDGSCFFVTHTVMNKDENPVWLKAKGFAAQNGWKVPGTLLTAGFRSANRTDVLDVRYHFVPETRGLPGEAAGRWKDSGWMAGRLDENRDRAAVAQGVSNWAVGYAAVVDASLKGRAGTDYAIPMPDPTRKTPAADAIGRHMAGLELLRQSGQISQKEYEVQAEALLENGQGSSSTAPDLSVVTAVKAFSYRVIVSISHIFVDYYWTGSYVATGALEVLQITINSAKFYMHELGWAKYMGVPRTDAARTIDFKYIGTNG
ncbi:DUF2061 domain-containing protein [Azospirillum sp. sgz301742]